MISTNNRREIVVFKLKMQFCDDNSNKNSSNINVFIKEYDNKANLSETYRNNLVVKDNVIENKVIKDINKAESNKINNNNIEDSLSIRAKMIFEFFDKDKLYKIEDELKKTLLSQFGMAIKWLKNPNRFWNKKKTKTLKVNVKSNIYPEVVEDIDEDKVLETSKAKVFHFFSFSLSDFGGIFKLRRENIKNVDKQYVKSKENKMNTEDSNTFKHLNRRQIRINALKEYFIKQFEFVDDYSP